MRRAIEAGGPIDVTVVPIVLSTTQQVGQPDDLLKYERVRIVTCR